MIAKIAPILNRPTPININFLMLILSDNVEKITEAIPITSNPIVANIDTVEYSRLKSTITCGEIILNAPKIDAEVIKININIGIVQMADTSVRL